MTPRRVLLFGGSMLLSLMARSLAQSPDLHVMQVVTWAEAGCALAETKPDALIFDLSQDHENHILPLLLKNPKLLLIGLDPESNHAVLLSGQEAHQLTIDRLIQIVREVEPLTT